MTIQHISPFILGATCFCCQLVSAATLQWNGQADGLSLHKASNWQNAAQVLPDNFKNVPAPHRFVIDRPDKVGGENGISGITDLGGSGSLSVTGEANFFRLSASATLKNGSAYFKTGTHTFNFQGVWEAMEVTIGRGIDLTYDTQTLHLKNGSTLDTQWLAYGTTTLDGGSTLKVRGNDHVFKNGHINLKDTQSKIIFTGGKSVNQVIKDHCSGNLSDTTSNLMGRILVNGQGAVPDTNIRIYTQDGLTYVQALNKQDNYVSIPELNCLALTAGALGFSLALMRRRRRL
jgi:hypothetical protein